MTTPDKPSYCNWRDFIKASADTPENVVKALDDHFSHYAPPGTKCPGCAASLTEEGIAGLLLATFRWGMVHGEGECGKCGWPATAHHFIRDENGKELMALRNFVLAAHPDFVERRAALALANEPSPHEE